LGHRVVVLSPFKMRAGRGSLWMLALLLVGCGSDDSGSTPSNTTDGGGGTSSGGTSGTGATGGSVGNGGTGGNVQPSPGCGKGAATQGLVEGTLTVDGTERTYEYYVTGGYAPNTPVPLVFGFHGNGGTGQQSASFGIQDAAESAGGNGVFFFPNGVAQNGGVGWAMSANGMDVEYFDAMVEYAKNEFCIDENRIFVAGFSWGCDFGNALGCYRGDVIRAVQCYSGAFYSNGCTNEVPAYRTSYSTPDGTDAYSEDELVGAVEHYQTAHGCSATTQASTPSPCLAYDGCAKPVIYCAYPNLGHSLPQTAGADTWAFFSSFD
jgi:polyhydroxybutyrate depolymerase